MENSKIILQIFLVVTIFSCTNKKSTYIKAENDIYQRNDSLFIKKSVPNMNQEGDSLHHFAYSVMLEGKERNLKNLVDLKTFTKLHMNHALLGAYYKDKNYLYIYNESPVYFPELNAIRYHESEVQFLGSDYYAIDNKIYFQSLEIKSANPKTFIVTDSISNGYYYAKDDRNFFYKEKQIHKNNRQPAD